MYVCYVLHVNVCINEVSAITIMCILLDYLGLGIKDLASVLKATWKARVKWYNIGLELDMDPGTLDVIKRDSDSTDERFRAMLGTWLKMVEPKPTWGALAEALRSPTVGYEHLAEQMQVLPGKLMFVDACKVLLYGVCTFQGGTIVIGTYVSWQYHIFLKISPPPPPKDRGGSLFLNMCNAPQIHSPF